MSQPDWTAQFEETFTGLVSAIRARIWWQVYGSEYPSWADPFSYVSVTELRRFADELRVTHGQCLVDIGCGRGGLGLWVAAVTGAELVGIDLDETAFTAARHRADQAGKGDQASFRRGGFADTGLPDGSAQAGDERGCLAVRAGQARRRGRAGPDPRSWRPAGPDHLGLPPPACRAPTPGRRSPSPH